MALSLHPLNVNVPVKEHLKKPNQNLNHVNVLGIRLVVILLFLLEHWKKKMYRFDFVCSALQQKLVCKKKNE